MPPIINKDSTNSTSSRLMAQLQEATAATAKLQQSLQPYIKTLYEAEHTGSSTHPHSVSDVDVVIPRDSPTSEHKKIVAKTVVALTLATICYLKPHLQRTSKSNQLITKTTSSSSSQAQQTQQIRSDLNHIRQLLKKVQECHKRKETSGQQHQPTKESSSKRVKRK